MMMLPNLLMLPPETRIQRGMASKLLEFCASFGRRGVLVCGNSLVRSGRLDSILNNSGHDIDVRVWLHPGTEPTLNQVETLLGIVREHEAEWVAAVGGGSVLDIAKAAAGLQKAPLPVSAYHDGTPIPHSQTAFIAVPTTAGAGSEATSVAVLTNSDTEVKRSIRHPSFMANLVILDADLLESCPPLVLAASGMDAFTQAVESYCSLGACWFTESLSIKALELIHGALELAYEGKKEAFGNLLMGSYLAGVALANARLGLVHGLAHPLGSRFHLPHGLVCAVCLPHVLEFNKEFIENKYNCMSKIIGNDLLTYIQALNTRLGLANPFYGETLRYREAIVEETLASGSTQANPRPVTKADVELLLDRLFTRELS